MVASNLGTIATASEIASKCGSAKKCGTASAIRGTIFNSAKARTSAGRSKTAAQARALR
jgi:hypothetical protein